MNMAANDELILIVDRNLGSCLFEVVDEFDGSLDTFFYTLRK